MFTLFLSPSTRASDSSTGTVNWGQERNVDVGIFTGKSRVFRLCVGLFVCTGNPGSLWGVSSLPVVNKWVATSDRLTVGSGRDRRVTLRAFRLGPEPEDVGSGGWWCHDACPCESRLRRV